MMMITTAFTELGLKKKRMIISTNQLNSGVFRPERKFAEQENAKPR